MVVRVATWCVEKHGRYCYCCQSVCFCDCDLKMRRRIFTNSSRHASPSTRITTLGTTHALQARTKRIAPPAINTPNLASSTLHLQSWVLINLWEHGPLYLSCHHCDVDPSSLYVPTTLAHFSNFC